MQLSTTEKKRLLSKYGEWAIVTGASSGIGLEITKCLASAGFSLVINARNEQRLIQLRKDLNSEYNCNVIVVAADVAESTGVDKIIQASNGLNIGLLVLSAGYGTSGSFIESSLHTEINMLRVNCEAVLSLTHYFSQRFVQQRRGGIIFLSSLVAFQGVPYASNYAATKAYIQSLAEAVASELKKYGVDVLAAAPGPIESGFGQRANMRMGTALLPSQVAVPILKALGKRTTVLPGLLTKILVYSLRIMPRWAKILIMEKVMNGFTKHQRV